MSQANTEQRTCGDCNFHWVAHEAVIDLCSKHRAVDKLAGALKGVLGKLDPDINCAYVTRQFCKDANAAKCSYHAAVAALSLIAPEETKS